MLAALEGDEIIVDILIACVGIYIYVHVCIYTHSTDSASIPCIVIACINRELIYL